MQESSSIYKLIEVSTGGKLSRHNIHIQQAGPDTVTELSTFHLSVTDQTQDLHSKLVLDHPRGYSQQLHKCIVAHSSGQAVFDGNVQVNRYYASLSFFPLVCYFQIFITKYGTFSPVIAMYPSAVIPFQIYPLSGHCHHERLHHFIYF